MKVRLLAVLNLMVTALGVFALAGAASAQDAYPARTIRLVVPFPPGGGADPVGRLVAQRLGDKWGRSIIVDNRPGGNTIIGNEIVAKAPPDGYTILLASTTLAITASTLNLPYHPVKDFDPVATVAKSPYVLVAHPSLPVKNLKELIALAKSRPGQINYGSTGTGGTVHLGTELLNIMAGTKMQHIPYKGSGPLTYDLLSGQIQLAFNNTIAAMAPLIKNGKLKGIAAVGESRMPLLPQVPTFAEAGLPGYELITWFAIVALAGTPKPIIDKMSAELAIQLAAPETREALAAQGMQPYISTGPDQVAALIRAEIAKYAEVVKKANIKID